MTTSTQKRPLPPQLEPRNPLCPICLEETTLVGNYFACEACEASWPLDNAFHHEGEWDDPDADQCRWTLIPWPNETRDFLRNARYRCVRQADHDGTKHFHPEYSYGFDEKDPHARLAEDESASDAKAGASNV